MSFPRERLLVCALVVACLLPFAGKAVHMDDPMYLWTAEQITRDPLDFYGFDVNWYGFQTPMYEVNQNPPLVSYYLAAVAGLLGWSELALHIGMLIPALALVLGTHALASRMTGDPTLAALACFATPVVLVSSTTLMCDVALVALWVWSLFFWLRGVEERRTGDLIAAAVLSALCGLTKYFGIALLPLLAAFALAHQRRVGAWALCLLIPIAVFAAYEAYMIGRYDLDPLREVSLYALSINPQRAGLLEKSLVGLSFAGGGLLGMSLLAGRLLPRRAWLAAGAAGVVLAAGIAAAGTIGGFPLEDAGGTRWGQVAQLSLFIPCGLGALALAGLDLYRRRDAPSLMLALWVGGVWTFCSFTNWTPTSRAILPMAPAVAILLVRALERGGLGPALRRRLLSGPLVLALGLALAVAYGDHQRARADRDAAEGLSQRYARRGRDLWFQGGWGFQYYMEAGGALRVALGRSVLRPGDVLVTPQNVSNAPALDESYGHTLAIAEAPSSRWIATMSNRSGAGFYAALWGPLPFVFGPNPPETYLVQEITRRLQPR